MSDQRPSNQNVLDALKEQHKYVIQRIGHVLDPGRQTTLFGQAADEIERLQRLVDALRRERDMSASVAGRALTELHEKVTADEPPVAPLKRIADASQEEAAVNQLFDMWWNASQSTPSYFQAYCAGHGAGVVRGAYGMAQPTQPPPVVQGPCPNCGAKWASVELRKG